jgi:hypothetical protein
MELTFGGRPNITFKNITQRSYRDEYGTYGHPHVDRGTTGHWCKGEGSGILILLRDFEFEAAVLFALKAINSVNDEGSGNYLAVLKSFPQVERVKEYPPTKERPNKATYLAFSEIFKGSGQEGSELKNNIIETRREIRAHQEKILRATLQQTLGKLTARSSDQKQKVSSLLKTQLALVTKIPDVRSVWIEKDVLHVVTYDLEAVDSVTNTSTTIGPVKIEADFRTGSILLKLNDTKVARERYLPHLPAQDGELPLGQLASTLPELLGNLEFETAISMSLEYLTNYVGEVGTEMEEQVA